MRLLILLLLFSSIAWAQEPNAKYSHKDFTNTVMTDAKDMDGILIEGSCFYQEGMPDRHIFPEKMTGVTFVENNLDNVFIPPGNIIIGGTHKNILVKNDMSDWILEDATLKPVEPMDKEERIKAGISIDPKDIPIVKAVKNVFEIKKDADAKISQ